MSSILGKFAIMINPVALQYVHKLNVLNQKYKTAYNHRYKKRD